MKSLSKRNKIVISAISLILVITMGIGVYFVIDNNKIIEAKHNDIYTIEYGTDFDIEQVKYYYSDYDNNINELKIDTYKMGGYGYPFTVKKTDMTLNVIVVDTQMPEITGIEDTYTITQGDELTIDAKGNDNVDGELEVKFDKEINFNEVGEQTIKATVEDKNGNVTEKEFMVVVEEKVEEIVEKSEMTNLPAKKPSTTKPVNKNNSASSNSSVNSNSNNVSDESKPIPVCSMSAGDVFLEINGKWECVEGGLQAVKPSPDAPSGMIFYKDYGYTNACAPKATEVLFENLHMLSTYCDDFGYMYYTPEN